jgi:hypothetical protein
MQARHQLLNSRLFALIESDQSPAGKSTLQIHPLDMV